MRQSIWMAVDLVSANDDEKRDVMSRWVQPMMMTVVAVERQGLLKTER